MPDISPVYHPRSPDTSQYYQCIEDNFETFEQFYNDRFPNYVLPDILTHNRNF